MDACAQITLDGLLRGPDDRFAIFAEPPGVRDLGLLEPWEHSLARSRRRRQAAAARLIALPKAATARVSAALLAAGIVGQSAPIVGAAVAAQSSTASGNLRSGSRGVDVVAAQRALGIPADGIFGRGTRTAVRAFQRTHGLVVDGRIGPQTAAALGLGGSPGLVRAVIADVAAPASDVTRAVQRAVGVAIDGVFGPQTRGAVVAFQRSHGLTADGVVGPQTLAALGLPSGAGSAAPTMTTVSAPATSAAPATSSAPAASSAGVQTAVAAAMSKIGAPYATAGNGPGSFDCSGLTSWAMGQAGISIPRTSFAQYGVGSAVSKDAIQAGDLVFFDSAGPGASDVGIATGPTTAVSATTHGVMNHAIFDGYWGSHFVGARRV
jgi:cell wall-associated NlpC family hydrolase